MLENLHVGKPAMYKWTCSVIWKQTMYINGKKQIVSRDNGNAVGYVKNW